MAKIDSNEVVNAFLSKPKPLYGLKVPKFGFEREKGQFHLGKTNRL